MDFPINATAPLCEAPVTQEQATAVMARLQGLLPGSQITKAAPSKLEGLVELSLLNGAKMYTDCQGQYVIMGLMFDLNSPREQLSGNSN